MTESMRPLAGVQVVELFIQPIPTGARLLAELGADVVLVEPPDAAADAGDGVDVHRAVEHAGKRSVTLDLDAQADRARLLALLGRADVLLENGPPGRLARVGLAPDVLRERFPRLVTTSVTDFGQTGPYASRRGSNDVHIAMSGMLSRSGLPGRPPLLPPGELAHAAAGAQAAWVTVLALLQREQHGHGEHLDVSALEATTQLLDPPYGVGGTASMGAPEENTTDRPDVAHRYPIFPCADGWVRIAVLGAGQWRGLFRWLGEPPDFADARYNSIAARFAARDRLYPLIAQLFSERTRADLVDEAARHGVPLEPLLESEEVLAAEHFAVRGALVEREVAPGVASLVASGHLEINGVRMGAPRRAPLPGEHEQVAPRIEGGGSVSPRSPVSPVERHRPLVGMRVLDLGIIVAGAELSRILADQGADVIKVESSRFPDGLRAAMGDAIMSANFARAHRNKRSIGIDLRSEEGRSLLLLMAERADVVVSNFKPGALEKLGLTPDAFRTANRDIVLAESSALGHTGPWSAHMGYGPLVRAVTGCTRLWRYPGTDNHSDAMTVYPDHTAARVCALAIASLLLARRHRRGSARVTLAQSEVILNQLAPLLLRRSLEAAGVAVRQRADAPCAVLPCAGDDQWCVVTVAGEENWRSLCDVIGRPDLAGDPALRTPAGRVARRVELEEAVAAWTRRHSPDDVSRTLQAAGVAAGPVRRRVDLPADEHLRARAFFDELVQPELDEPLLVERSPARSLGFCDPEQRPAPLLGANTREVLREVLGLSDQRIDELLAAGVVEEPAADSGLHASRQV